MLVYTAMVDTVTCWEENDFPRRVCENRVQGFDELRLSGNEPR